MLWKLYYHNGHILLKLCCHTMALLLYCSHFVIIVLSQWTHITQTVLSHYGIAAILQSHCENCTITEVTYCRNYAVTLWHCCYIAVTLWKLYYHSGHILQKLWCQTVALLLYYSHMLWKLYYHRGHILQKLCCQTVALLLYCSHIAITWKLYYHSGHILIKLVLSCSSIAAILQSHVVKIVATLLVKLCCHVVALLPYCSHML